MRIPEQGDHDSEMILIIHRHEIGIGDQFHPGIPDRGERWPGAPLLVFTRDPQSRKIDSPVGYEVPELAPQNQQVDV
jgi:hypothetical protein